MGNEPWICTQGSELNIYQLSFLEFDVFEVILTIFNRTKYWEVIVKSSLLIMHVVMPI